jgi:Ca2+-binding EF-hand superfamily protein
LRGAAAAAESHDEAIGERREAAYPAAMSSDPLRDRFERVDSDGNGKIDQTEFGSLLDALGVGFSDAQIRAAFEAIDHNRSGLIDLEEFRAWWTTR